MAKILGMDDNAITEFISKNLPIESWFLVIKQLNEKRG